MKKLVGMTVAVVALLFVATAEPVQAQLPGFGCNGFGSFGSYGSPYALGRVPVPPYFALHPPVYYSQPMPRTYGYSPFAYPGTMETPPAPMPEAKQIIHNPHVTPAVRKVVEDSLTAKASGPREILNPHVNTKLVSLQR